MTKFFLGMEDELLIVKKELNDYSVTTHLKGTHPTEVAIDPIDKNIVYCATYGNGLWKSIDGGDNWEAIGQSNAYHEPTKGNGITSAYVTAIAINPLQNNILYVGTEPSEMYYSNDYGETFSEYKEVQNLYSKPFWQFPARPYTNHIQCITPSFLNDSTINVAIEFGAFINTYNNGESWNDRKFLSPKDIHALSAHPLAPGRLYAACGDGLLSPGNSYAESTDDGNTWTYMSEGLEKHPYLYSLTLNPNDTEDRLVSAAVNAIHAHHKDSDINNRYSTVYRKTNENAWYEISNGLSCEGAFIHELAYDPVEPNTFYALSNLGLFKYSAEYNSWNKIPISWENKYNSQHPSFLVVV